MAAQTGHTADVGSGYPVYEAQLALVAHRWMLAEAFDCGLQLDREAAIRQLAGWPDAGLAAAHDSMSIAWKLAEWVPRRVWSGLGSRKEWLLGTMPPFGKPRHRFIEAKSAIHRSVAQW